MDLIDYLLFAFLGWAAFDTYKQYGWVIGTISILTVLFFALAVVFIPYLFGDLGKNILLILLLLICCFAIWKKYKKRAVKN